MQYLSTLSKTLLKLTFFAGLFITPLIFTSLTSELFEIPKMIFVYVLTATLICLYLVHCYANRKIIITKNPILIIFTIFIITLGISTIFSTDHHLSVFGYYTRLNGSLLSTICYYIIFFIVSSTLSRKEAIEGIKFIVLSAVLVSLWGIPGHFGYDPNCFVLTGKLTSSCWKAEFQPTLRIFSTLGQPNWLGAFLAMTIPFSITLVLSSKGFQKIFFTASAFTILLGLVLTNSRSAFLSLLISIGILILLLGVKKIKSNLTILIIILFGSIFILSIFGRPLWERNLEAIRQNLFFLQQPQKNLERSAQTEDSSASAVPSSTSLESGGTESGTIRLIVWQGAIEIFKNHPILGTGPETFAISYYRFRPSEHNQTTEWNFLYNKAHNEYLNYLSNTGIIGISAYLILIFGILFIILKNLIALQNQLKMLQLGLFSSAISYLIVNFFGFSVVATSLFFFVIPAFSYILSDSNHTYQIRIPKKIPIHSSIITGTILIIFIFLLVTISRIFLADVYYSRYQKELGTGRITRALKNIQSASNISPYLEPLYHAETAYIASIAAENSFDIEQRNYIELAVNEISKSLNDSPNNVGLWRKAQSTYFELSLSDPKFLDLAINAGEITIQLAPTDPAAYYNLGLIQKTAGKKEEAYQSFSKALELKPNYQEALSEKENLKN